MAARRPLRNPHCLDSEEVGRANSGHSQKAIPIQTDPSRRCESSLTGSDESGLRSLHMGRCKSWGSRRNTAICGADVTKSKPTSSIIRIIPRCAVTQRGTPCQSIAPIADPRLRCRVIRRGSPARHRSASSRLCLMERGRARSGLPTHVTGISPASSALHCELRQSCRARSGVPMKGLRRSVSPTLHCNFCQSRWVAVTTKDILATNPRRFRRNRAARKP
jgi:hypothetical protein